MNEINKEIADKIITHLIDISNDKLVVSEADIIAEKDESLQEILIGLKHLSEDLIYNKENTAKITEQIKNKNTQLIKQNEELEHFAYIISHDLKAPLLALHTLASFIEEDLLNNQTENVLSHLSHLKKRIERMESLIEGILNFSKIGMTKSKKETIDLNKLAKEVFDILDAPKTFEFEIVNNLPTIQGVKALFIQLFSNITTNAIKFNDKENGTFHILYKDLQDKHQFSFKDNGSGIPLKYQEKVFMVFQTLDNKDLFKKHRYWAINYKKNSNIP